MEEKKSIVAYVKANPVVAYVAAGSLLIGGAVGYFLKSCPGAGLENIIGSYKGEQVESGYKIPSTNLIFEYGIDENGNGYAYLNVIKKAVERTIVPKTATPAKAPEPVVKEVPKAEPKYEPEPVVKEVPKAEPKAPEPEPEKKKPASPFSDDVELKGL